jgi:hypothetical protein
LIVRRRQSNVSFKRSRVCETLKMGDPRGPLPNWYTATEPPERFSPLDYGEKLAAHAGTAIRIMSTNEKRAAQGFRQKLGMTLAIHRLTGNFYRPEEAVILLRYARKSSDLSYDPEAKEFLVRVSEDLKPPERRQIEQEIEAGRHKIRVSIGRPGHFWRKHYFLSCTLELTIYRQLSHIACGHPVRLREGSDLVWAPVERLAKEDPVCGTSPDGPDEELCELVADIRALWLLKITRPRPFIAETLGFG